MWARAADERRAGGPLRSPSVSLRVLGGNSCGDPLGAASRSSPAARTCPRDTAATCAPHLSALLGLEPALRTLTRWAPPGSASPLLPGPSCLLCQPRRRTEKEARPSPAPGPFLGWTRKLVGGLGENREGGRWGVGGLRPRWTWP